MGFKFFFQQPNKKCLLTGIFSVFLSLSAFAQKMVVQNGHQYGGTSSLAISNNGKYLATGGGIFDGKIKIWHIKSGKEVKTYHGHQGAISGITFSKDDKFIASSSWDKTVKIWTFPSGELISTISGQFDNVNCLTFNDDGDLLAFGMGGVSDINDNSVRIWDWKNNKELANYNHRELVLGIDFFENSVVASSGISDKIDISLWNIEKNELVFLKKDIPSEKINKVCFIDNGQYILTGGEDKMVKVWSSKNGELLTQLAAHPYPIADLVFLPATNSLICSSGGKYWSDDPGMLSYWHFDFENKNNNVLKSRYENQSGITALVSNKDGYVFFTDEQAIVEWDLERAKVSRKFKSHLVYANEVFLLAENDILVDFSNHSVSLIHLNTGTIELLSQDSIIDIDRKGNVLAAASVDKIFVWNLKDRTLKNTISSKHPIDLIEISPDEDYIISISENEKKLKTYLTGYALRDGKKIQKINFDAKDIFVFDFERIKFFKDNWTVGGLDNDSFIEIDIKDGNAKIYPETSKYPMLDFHFLAAENKILTVGGIDPLLYNTEFLRWDRTQEKIEKSMSIHTNVASCIDGTADLVATGSYDGWVKLWALPDFELVDSIQVDGFVLDLAFSDDGQSLIVAGLGVPIKIIDLPSKKALNIVNHFKTGNYVFFSEDGYYKSNKNQIEAIGFEFKNEGFGFEQFDLKYNRPDKIISFFKPNSTPLQAAYYNAYLKRLKIMGFEKDSLSKQFTAPAVELILDDTIKAITENAELMVELNVADLVLNLDRINVDINGVPLFGRKGINLRPQNTKIWNQKIAIPLSIGDNKIQVSALNRGGAESLKETIYITYDAPPRKSNLYFIAIGTDEFANAAYNLKYPLKDLRQTIDLFQSNAEDYEKIIIDTLFNTQINDEKLQTIKEVLNASHVDDRVILFFAGHGMLDDSLDYYLATPETDFLNPADGGLRYELLENLLDSIPARNKLLLMDACHSGEIDKEDTYLAEMSIKQQDNITFRSFANTPKPKHIGLNNSFELMKHLFMDLRRGTGATVISSASGVEFAWEGDQWNNSVFTYCLLSGLADKTADLNKDGQVMATELQQFLAKEVARITNNQQQPTMRVTNISNDWKIY